MSKLVIVDPYSESPEATEEHAHVADEQLRHLHGREVAAVIEVRPVHDVVAALSVAADRDVLGKCGHTGRRGAALLAPRERTHVLVVQPGRGAGGTGEPVDRDVGEDEVTVDG